MSYIPIYYCLPLTAYLQILSLKSDVSTAKFLQCGQIISQNLAAVSNGLDELVRLVSMVMTHRSEANIIIPILNNARDTLAAIMSHVDLAIWDIQEALVMVSRCTRNEGVWHALPTHLEGFQNHSRRVHELWPHTRDFLVEDLLPALCGQFFSFQSIFPHAALWVAQVTRSAHFFPRLQAWGQFPIIITDICAALDPVPSMLDDVETYAVDMGERLQLVVSKSSYFRDEETKKLRPIMSHLYLSWASYFKVSRRKTHHVQHLKPSEYLRFRRV